MRARPRKLVADLAVLDAGPADREDRVAQVRDGAAGRAEAARR